MEWTTELLDRLYPCYEEHDARLRADIIAANRSLGSPHPEKVKLQCLTRAEFEELLREEPFDAEARRLWLRRILRDQESRFPELHELLNVRQIAVEACKPDVEWRRRTGA